MLLTEGGDLSSLVMTLRKTQKLSAQSHPPSLAAILRGAGCGEKRWAFNQSYQPSSRKEWLLQEVLGSANQDGGIVTERFEKAKISSFPELEKYGAKLL